MTLEVALQWATAGAAIALAVLTLAYTVATILLFRETRIARLEALQPSLHLSPQVLGVNYPIARVTNVGRGYAKNIRGDLWVTVADKEVWRYRWHMDLIAPADCQEFLSQSEGEQQPNAVEFAKAQRQFHMDLKYEDGLGRTYLSKGSANWVDIADHLFGAQMRRKNDHVARIEKHLEDIAESLNHAVDTFDGVRVLTYRERKLKEEAERRWIEERTRESDEDPPSKPMS